ncbi:OmpA family protein [Melittangium boletus]|uniref:Cell envelope biogenesis protein OmpA n=1 Tax=Melittangium boletus DSM 14713 TaxID=1294270 RepID=A0A286NUU5_9BACT|nr:OmpA family protein [Melittangium boletus]ATB26776.1 cell envelope biogenesis protein OmpA [Melittangium boletus DSM 14713]
MGRRVLWPGALVLSLLLRGGAAFAQQTPFKSFELERLDFNPGAEGSLVVGMGELLEAHQYRLSAVGHYSHQPLVFFERGAPTAAVRGRSTLHVSAAYAPLNWLQVGLQLPVVMLQLPGPALPNPDAPKSLVLGTPTVGVRLGLFTQDDQGGFDVAVEGDLGLNVGSEAAYARDAGLRFMPRLMVGRHLGALRVALDAGLLIRPGGRITELAAEARDELGNEVRIGGAVASTGRRTRWEFNVRGMVPLSAQPFSMEVLPGVRYLVNPSVEVFTLAGVGIGKAPGTPLFRLLAGGSFGDVTPRRGPKEGSVRCDLSLPLPPEECPNNDNDGDGVRNIDDKCPLKWGDRLGCPRSDRDNDGLDDELDACPSQPGPVSHHGCPVRDQDGDKVEDDEDSCPTRPGPVENGGCPVLDRDNDKIPNDEDMCPDEPGPPERQGCPEEDSDKDGVPNREDSCVNEPGGASNFGCPTHELPLVSIKVDKLELSNKVSFEKSQVRIKQGSYLVLDWVAKVLREHPEIPRVKVGAHTDDQGLAEQNRLLSRQRAEAVRRYLIDKGVAAERLEAQGYGPDVPVDTNLTANGRENNRRVEFIILRDGRTGEQVPRP